jgi:GST-like protein
VVPGGEQVQNTSPTHTEQEHAVITLYTWTTPNGRKPAIMLEELGVDYRLKPVDISAGAQFERSYLAISPNNKIPAIVDDNAHGVEGGRLSIFESGAILTYLAEKHGRFLDASGPGRYKAQELLNWQVAGLGPMLGQLGHFSKSENATTEHFRRECERLLDVMEKRLNETPYLAGEEYTIADIAAYPWTVAAATRLETILGDKLEGSPALQQWLDTVGERPAVQRGMALDGL